MMADQPSHSMDSEAEKKVATAAALRVQLQNELKSVKQCLYKGYDCTQLALEKRDYCGMHILKDKSAPYKQCSFVYNTNGKRCHLPVHKEKKDNGYCTEHDLKHHINLAKRNNQCQPPHTAEVLLNLVSHYVKRPKSQAQLLDDNRSITPDEGEGIVTKSLNPFVDIDAHNVLHRRSDILDMCSESESDVEPTGYGSVWHDIHAESSDDDSIDSEQEDVLKHAKVFTSEEAVNIVHNKLKRLQSLYADQYRYLQHALKEHRRRYLIALKQEKETHCNIYNQVHENVKEQRLYKKLKAYNSYRKPHGTEAVCLKRRQERRLKATDGYIPKQQSYTKCIFTEGGVKCGERTLPVTRHCLKHILEDPNQILFRACGKMYGDIECRTPVETIFDDVMCRLHTDFPPLHTYNHVRKDSESDADDCNMAKATNANIKVEGVDNIKTEESFLPELNLENEILKLESACDIGTSEMPNLDADISNMIPFVEDLELPSNTEQLDESITTIDNNIVEVKTEVPMDI